jgi:hypothetical protein
MFLEHFRQSMGLDSSSAWTVWGLILAVEHGWPQLRVRERLMTEPGALARTLRKTVGDDAAAGDEVPRTEQERLAETSAEDPTAPLAWRALARVIDELRQGQRQLEIVSAPGARLSEARAARVIVVGAPDVAAGRADWESAAAALRVGVKPMRSAVSGSRAVRVLTEPTLPMPLAIELGWQLRARDIEVGDKAPLTQTSKTSRRDRLPFFDQRETWPPTPGEVALHIDIWNSGQQGVQYRFEDEPPTQQFVRTRRSDIVFDREMAGLAPTVANDLLDLADGGATRIRLTVAGPPDVGIIIGHLVPEDVAPIVDLFEADDRSGVYRFCFRLGGS